MKPFLVLYATREGHTRKICEHVAATLRSHALEADVVQAKAGALSNLAQRHAAAIVAASVHGGQHEREMVDFVKEHRSELEQLPTAFLSVSLSEASAENAQLPAVKRAEAEQSVRQAIDRFCAQTGWRPERIKAVAGALLYTQYGRVVRLVMRLMAKKMGGPSDTGRDHEFTDWVALDRFVDELVAELRDEP